MIRVVMFDLGQTLIDANNQPFPHVTEALAAMANQSFLSCLVSDFDMSLTPAVAMRRYLAILGAAGLRSFFEPVNKRVTLSNHAGVTKPNRKIFRKALERLDQPGAPLTACLFITENAAHVEAARKLRMKSLQFGADFSDWSQLPGLIASGPAASGGAAWVPISVPGHDDLGTILVEVPEAVPEQVEEARSYVASLAAHNRIAGRPGKPALQATHAIETDQHGNRRLVRKGFSAFSTKAYTPH